MSFLKINIMDLEKVSFLRLNMTDLEKHTAIKKKKKTVHCTLSVFITVSLWFIHDYLLARSSVIYLAISQVGWKTTDTPAYTIPTLNLL